MPCACFIILLLKCLQTLTLVKMSDQKPLLVSSDSPVATILMAEAGRMWLGEERSAVRVHGPADHTGAFQRQLADQPGLYQFTLGRAWYFPHNAAQHPNMKMQFAAHILLWHHHPGTNGEQCNSSLLLDESQFLHTSLHAGLHVFVLNSTLIRMWRGSAPRSLCAHSCTYRCVCTFLLLVSVRNPY